MDKIRGSLSRWPRWILSVITVLAILWLTLAPKPLGDEPPPLIPGADKLAHSIMFGGLVWMMLLDWQRSHEWRKVDIKYAFCVASISSLFGIFIEILQKFMGLGRGFEIADIIADIIGSFFFAYIYFFFQKKWSLKSHK